MYKTLMIGMAVMMAGSLSVAGVEKMKLYDVKSGKIDYAIKGSGNIMGQKMKTVGKKRVIFDNYGAKNLTEEVKAEQQTIMGQKKVSKTHTLTLINEEIIYSADMKRKRITRTQNMAAAMGAHSGQNMNRLGKEMMQKMGGKKTGTDKVLGYTCEVWEVMGTKQCIYKGIPLKVESNVMGIKNTEVATKAVFDLPLSNNDFKLPDFPVYDMYGNKLDKHHTGRTSQQQQAPNASELEALGAVMAAAMQSKNGNHSSQAQQSMEDAMMTAMLPQIKREMLSQEKSLLFAKKCLSKADTLKEAQVCAERTDTMSGQPRDRDDRLTKWDKQTKEETLGEIDEGLKSAACMKKATTMKAMKQCMPQQ